MRHQLPHWLHCSQPAPLMPLVYMPCSTLCPNDLAPGHMSGSYQSLGSPDSRSQHGDLFWLGRAGASCLQRAAQSPLRWPELLGLGLLDEGRLLGSFLHLL